MSVEDAAERCPREPSCKRPAGHMGRCHSLRSAGLSDADEVELRRAFADRDDGLGDRIYDRDGRPMTYAAWSLVHGDDTYRRIAETEVDDYWISTVWLGLDHNYWPNSPPLIFETMIFRTVAGEPIHSADLDLDEHDLDGELWRYSAEAAALAGHDQIVALVRERVGKHENAKRPDA